MFLIAGVQPRSRLGPKTDSVCPHCGLAQVYEKRIDHYFSLFFIPLIRVKRGAGFNWCERCQTPVSGGSVEESTEEGRTSGGLPRCMACGANLEPSFRFCPHCGRPRG